MAENQPTIEEGKEGATPTDVSVDGGRPKRRAGIGYTRETPPSYAVVSKKPEYWLFVDWLSTFLPNRQHKTQREFSATINIGEDTLTKWKLMPELTVDVIDAIRRKIKVDQSANVMHGWASRLPASGHAADIELFLEYFHNYSRNTRVEVTDRTLTEEERKAIDEVFEKNRKPPRPQKTAKKKRRS
jgi:DNA modification methylase